MPPSFTLWNIVFEEAIRFHYFINKNFGLIWNKVWCRYSEHNNFVSMYLLYFSLELCFDVRYCSSRGKQHSCQNFNACNCLCYYFRLSISVIPTTRRWHASVVAFPHAVRWLVEILNYSWLRLLTSRHLFNATDLTAFSPTNCSASCDVHEDSAKISSDEENL